MRQTLFTIPYVVNGVPLFGVGVLLGAWLLFGVVLLTMKVRRHGWGREMLSYLPMLLLVAAAILFVPRVFADGLPIRGYGVLLLLGVVAGVGLAAHRAQQMGVDADLIYGLAFWMFVAGIVGARLFHVMEYRENYQSLGDVLNVPQGGLVVYGSLIGAGLAFVLFSRRHKLPMLAMADLVAPSLVIGLALGRLGCLMNGCCFGGQCDRAWAVTFPPGSPPYSSQLAPGTGADFALTTGRDGVVVAQVVAEGPAAASGLAEGDRILAINGVQVESQQQADALVHEAFRTARPLVLSLGDGRYLELRSLPVHPTQIYSAINAALLCQLTIAVYPFRRRDGEVIALLLTIYPVSRFLLELIRTDESAVFGTGLSISQNVSVWILLGVVAMWVYVLRQPRGSALPAAA
jgi:phosphatidylglycerol:prolipoprotein diacylglycerol transferase